MTYLDLLNKIKDKTNPKCIMFNNDIYIWHGRNYESIVDDTGLITDLLDECDMPTKNCIWALIVDKEEEPEKTLGELLAEKCF